MSLLTIAHSKSYLTKITIANASFEEQLGWPDLGKLLSCFTFESFKRWYSFTFIYSCFFSNAWTVANVNTELLLIVGNDYYVGSCDSHDFTPKTDSATDFACIDCKLKRLKRVLQVNNRGIYQD